MTAAIKDVVGETAAAALTAAEAPVLTAPARQLHQRLITNIRDSIAAFEDWTKSIPPGPTKTLYEYVIRLTKGVVKAWRVWLTHTR